jgi:signal transduction histidine kinase
LDLVDRLRLASAGRSSVYLLGAVSAAEESGSVLAEASGSGGESQRVSEARSRAERRLRRQRGTLRPLGWAVIVVVAVGTLNVRPAPGLHGRGLWVTLALCVFIASLAIAIRDRFPELGYAMQGAVISATGAAGAALTALQPKGATGLAGGAAVWMAVARLPLVAAIVLAAVITTALDVAAALSGSSSAAVLATTLLCALLGLMAYFMKQARESQARTELLLAQLQDAREEQTRAAAIAERGRIAGELHDVLAHSLSAAAIQLQGARMLAEREQAGSHMRAAIDRASGLVKDGLANARRAVGALRGEELPSVMHLPSLIESFKDDMRVDVTLRIEGAARPLPADASLALYRGAQEALTNVARYAPSATTIVVLSYQTGGASLIVEDRVPTTSSPRELGRGLEGVGGGRGLSGMRERVERAGGRMQAGPTEQGWRVELEVPAGAECRPR